MPGVRAAGHPAPRPLGGFRPPPTDRLTLRGKVTLAERLGRSVELSVAVGGDTLIAMTSDQRVGEGDEVTLAVEWSRVHLFGGPNGDAPRLGAAVAAGGAR